MFNNKSVKNRFGPLFWKTRLQHPFFYKNSGKRVDPGSVKCSLTIVNTVVSVKSHRCDKSHKMTVRGSFLEGFGVTFGIVWALLAVFGTHFGGRKTDEQIDWKNVTRDDPRGSGRIRDRGAGALKDC